MRPEPIDQARACRPNRNWARRFRQSSARLIASLILVACFGCGADATRPENKASSDVDLGSDFPMAITGGTNPAVTFNGVRGGSLSFEDQDGGTFSGNDVWYFFAPYDGNGFGSPVNYGVLPEGAYCGLASGTDFCPYGKPLIRGHRYLVILLTKELKAAVHLYTP